MRHLLTINNPNYNYLSQVCTVLFIEVPFFVCICSLILSFYIETNFLFIIATTASLSIIALGLILACQIALKLYTLITQHNTPRSIQITRSLQAPKERPRIVNSIQNLETNSSENTFPISTSTSSEELKKYLENQESDPTSCEDLKKYLENQESDPTIVERLSSSFPELLCPITRDLIEKPTTIDRTKLHQKTKFVYEYESIKSWIDTKKTCPMTRVEITNLTNNAAQQLIPDSGYKSILIKCILKEKLQSFKTEELPENLANNLFHRDPVLQYLTTHENTKTLAALEELQIERVTEASNYNHSL